MKVKDRKKLVALVLASVIVLGNLSPVNAEEKTEVNDIPKQQENISEEVLAEEPLSIRDYHFSEEVTMKPYYSDGRVVEGGYFRNAMPSTGNVKTLVFLVEFTDVKNTDSTINAESVKENFFGEGEYGNLYGSVANYYENSSYGKLHLDGDVYGWYGLAHDREYYRNAEAGREEIIKEVFDYYDSRIDFSDYDSDGDGYLDSFYILYAGAPDGYAGFYWGYTTTAGREMQYDDVLLNGYVFQFTDAYVVTAIHETGHLLGLVDYYNPDQASSFGGIKEEAGGVGNFDMMDHNYGDHNVFSKMLLGWVEPEFVTADSEITLFPVSSPEAKAVIITPDGEATIYSEYYVLELCTNEGNNKNSLKFGDGAVRIYHVNAQLDEDKHFKNRNNGTETKLIKLLESDGSEENGLFGYPVTPDKLYYAGMEFGINTVPSSEFYGGKYTGIRVEINAIEDGTARVSVGFEEEDTESPQVIGTNSSGVLGMIHNLAEYVLYFSSYIYEGEHFGEISVYAKENPEEKLEATAGIVNPRKTNYPDSVNGYNILCVSCRQELLPDTDYVIEIPAGAVKDAYGNGNESIKHTVHTLITVDNCERKVLGLQKLPDSLPEEVETSGMPLFYMTADAFYTVYSLSARDYAGTDAGIVLRKHTKDGEKLIDRVIPLEGSLNDWGQSYKMFPLENGNLCVVLKKGYVILDDEGELIDWQFFEGFDSGSGVEGCVEREDCIDFYDGNLYQNHVICRIYYEDGRYQELETVFSVYPEMAYLQGPDYDEDIDTMPPSIYDKFRRNNLWVYAINGDNSQTYTKGAWLVPQCEEGAKKIYLFHSMKSYAGGFLPVHQQDGHLVELDRDEYLMLDMNLSRGYRMLAGVYEILKIADGDGYLVNVGNAKYNGGSYYLGRAFVRLDDKFNVKWVYTPPIDRADNFIGAYFWKDKIYAVSTEDLMVMEDRQEVLFSSEKKFSFSEESGISVDEQTQTLTIPAGSTLGDIQSGIAGSYGEVKFYDSEMRQVTDKSATADGGLMEISAGDGIYTWYYKLKWDVEVIEGTVTVKGGTMEGVSLRILSGKEEVIATEAENDRFSISGLSDGTYTLEISKKNYATYKYEFTVKNGFADSIDVELHLIGDIDGDGYANMKDLNRICDHIRGKKKLTGYEFACADITEDGKSVDARDLNRLCDHVRNKKLLWE